MRGQLDRGPALEGPGMVQEPGRRHEPGRGAVQQGPVRGLSMTRGRDYGREGVWEGERA